MAIYDLYSKRKRASSATEDVLQYDFVPQRLRVQIVHVWDEMIGEVTFNNPARDIFYQTAKILRKEYGVAQLSDVYNQGIAAEVLHFFYETTDTDVVLDVIEVVMDVAKNIIRRHPHYNRIVNGVTATHAQATEEINARFLERGVGYEIVGGRIMRVDSQVVHSEAIIPALTLLRDYRFDGPNEEYREAHAQYRHGDAKGAILNAAKAFESTMKTICALRGWEVAKDATAKPLIAALLRNQLLPPYMEAQLNDVQRVLESGVGMIRNKTSGHGDGPSPVRVDDFYARYALNLAATTILFLVEAHHEKG